MIKKSLNGLCSSLQSRIGCARKGIIQLNIKTTLNNLCTETVESATLTLECIDNVHSRDSATLCVSCVGDGVTDDLVEEDLEDTVGLLVDGAGDTLDTTTTGETTDGGLGDALDVVTHQLAMALGSLCTLASERDVLASLTTSRHGWLM